MLYCFNEKCKFKIKLPIKLKLQFYSTPNIEQQIYNLQVYSYSHYKHCLEFQYRLHPFLLVFAPWKCCVFFHFLLKNSLFPLIYQKDENYWLMHVTKNLYRGVQLRLWFLSILFIYIISYHRQWWMKQKSSDPLYNV